MVEGRSRGIFEHLWIEDWKPSKAVSIERTAYSKGRTSVHGSIVCMGEYQRKLL